MDMQIAEMERAMGGSRSCATDNAADVADVADAQERVPPDLGDTDALERVPPVDGMPQRRHPSRNSVMTYLDNRSIILFVTVVAEKRRPILATPEMHRIIVNAWGKADFWAVGRYVIMPDHVHFFCAPRSLTITGFHRWMAYWKSLAAKSYWRIADAQERVPPDVSDAQERIHPDVSDAQERVPPARNPPLFQRDCWDRQLRNGESYSEKWHYVRNNPVRKGLVADADDWPFQGEICQFIWHERV